MTKKKILKNIKEIETKIKEKGNEKSLMDALFICFTYIYKIQASLVVPFFGYQLFIQNGDVYQIKDADGKEVAKTINKKLRGLDGKAVNVKEFILSIV
ncbi:hypothetical protein [Eubacterium oxidoreducens]|uniref:Uncharacterized protein n=1 Tax=Eubacterium oxidoreducens TaxID=1732 RepID=A0A1G6B362_EUBOX|nr:hypothetical protein [Eubacterium oxidoreducens]SDB15084.1 hypothetical protein SAMN02910417_01110 [Eubacterium oxidoreducens]